MTDTTPSDPPRKHTGVNARTGKPKHHNTKTPAQAAAYRARQREIAAQRKANGETPIKLRPVGKPTLYRPEYCDTVLDDALNGHTLTGTAHLIGVKPQTLIDWADRYPDFADAVARAKSARLRKCEDRLNKLAESGGDSAQLGALKFQMTNFSSDDYRERFETTSNVNVSLSSLITDAMKTIEHEATAPKRLAKPDEDE